MKILYRYRSDDSDITVQNIIDSFTDISKPRNHLYKDNAEIAEILDNSMYDIDTYVILLADKTEVIFDAWKHYGIMLDDGSIFADLGKDGTNCNTERQRLRDHIESSTDTCSEDLDSIIF